jgi:hypothetical protein
VNLLLFVNRVLLENTLMILVIYVRHARPARFQTMAQAHVYDVHQENTRRKLSRLSVVIASNQVGDIQRTRA